MTVIAAARASGTEAKAPSSVVHRKRVPRPGVLRTGLVERVDMAWLLKTGSCTTCTGARLRPRPAGGPAPRRHSDRRGRPAGAGQGVVGQAGRGGHRRWHQRRGGVTDRAGWLLTCYADFRLLARSDCPHCRRGLSQRASSECLSVAVSMSSLHTVRSFCAFLCRNLLSMKVAVLVTAVAKRARLQRATEAVTAD